MIGQNLWQRLNQRVWQRVGTRDDSDHSDTRAAILMYWFLGEHTEQAL